MQHQTVVGHIGLRRMLAYWQRHGCLDTGWDNRLPKFSVKKRLEHKEFAVCVMISFNLRTPVRSKIHKDSYRELRGTHIPKYRNYYPSIRRFSLISFVRISGLKCLSSLAFQLLFVAQLLSPMCSQYVSAVRTSSPVVNTGQK